MIYSCTVRVQINTRHTFAKCLLDFANTNLRQNIANMSFLVLCQVPWHVVGSGELCVDSDKVSTEADWSAPQDINGV